MGTRVEIAAAPATPLARQGAGDLARLMALATFVLVAPTFTLATWYTPYNIAVHHFAIPVLGAEAILIACSISSGVSPLRALKGLARTTLYGALGVLVVGFCASVINAPVRGDAALHLLATLLHMAFCLCLWQALEGPWRDMRRAILACLAAGIGLHIIIGYPLLLSVRHEPDVNWMRPFLGGTNVRHLGYYASSLCGLSAGLYATSRNSRERWFYLLLLLLGFAWNDLSGGRGSFGAGIVGAAVVWLLAEKGERRRAALGFAATFALALPLSMVWVPPSHDWGIQNMIGRASDVGTGKDVTNGRWALWLKTLNGIAQYPLLGHGEGQFFFNEGARAVHHPHNSILQFLYQWGLLGTAAVITMSVATLRAVRGALAKKPEVAVPALGALSALLALSMIDGTLYHEFPVMVVLVCLAAVAGIGNEGEPA